MSSKKKKVKQEIRKICAICGNEFIAKSIKAMYCSDKCKRIANQDKLEEWKARKLEEKYKDNPNILTCLICGKKMLDLKPHIVHHHKISIEDYCKQFDITDPTTLSASVLSEIKSKAQKESTNPNRRRFTSENNPGKNHGGRLSPFSTKFVAYDSLSEEEKIQHVKEIAKKANDTAVANCNRTTQISYFTSRGFSEEEAAIKLKERQRTFSREKCIAKFGDTKGIRVWLDRQERWMNNLAQQNYSPMSQEFFKKLDVFVSELGLTTYYAEKGVAGENNEKVLKLADRCISPDFLIEELKLIIEFDGEYWHGEARGNKQRDEDRDLSAQNSGYTVYRVRERDFLENADKVTTDCFAFILQHFAKRNQSS